MVEIGGKLQGNFAGLIPAFIFSNMHKFTVETAGSLMGSETLRRIELDRRQFGDH